MSSLTATPPSSSPTEASVAERRPSPDDGRSAAWNTRLPDAVTEALASGRGPVPIPLRGRAIMRDPLLYKGAATPLAERIALGLVGLIPPGVIRIEDQVQLELEHIRRKQDPLEQYIGLAATHDRAETLFFRLLVEHLEEFLPIVYTPTVGLACQEYSHIMRRPRGLWISPDDIGRMPAMLADAARGDVRLIVVTDNERILGLGDQGAGGMGIPIGKLALYTAAAGIHPSRTLPISLDVGTDRETLLNDPLYLGWRGRRLRGEAYDEVVEAFVLAVREVFPRAILQWEDFKQHNALRLLDRYRGRLATFNDDIQGTAAVVLGGILAGLRHLGGRLRDQRFVLAGAGAAGIGIARLLAVAMQRDGATEAEAHRAIVLLDSQGLVHEGRPGIDADKMAFAWPAAAMTAAGLTGDGPFDLARVVRAVRPTVLLGTTGTPGTFTRRVLRTMADATPTPIVLPLSNPTANAEATPSDILASTGGRALVASGSPFDPVPEPDGDRLIGQANNVFVFPGIGLGAIVAQASAIPDRAFLAAADAMAAMVSDDRLVAGAIYPPVAELRAVSRAVAIEVARALRDAGVGRAIDDDEIPAAVDAAMWWPDYLPYEAI
jgi:malate dehydrogenase (oxaloacetate-decarboxylating)